MRARVRQFAATAAQPAFPHTQVLPGPKARLYSFPVRQEPSLGSGNGMGALRGAIFAIAAEGVVAACLYGLWHLWHVMR